LHPKTGLEDNISFLNFFERRICSIAPSSCRPSIKQCLSGSVLEPNIGKNLLLGARLHKLTGMRYTFLQELQNSSCRKGAASDMRYENGKALMVFLQPV
jgi:hypothetical protein